MGIFLVCIVSLMLSYSATSIPSGRMRRRSSTNRDVQNSLDPRDVDVRISLIRFFFNYLTFSRALDASCVIYD
jgi:hypothetical protein